jgi:hypothetical protein
MRGRSAAAAVLACIVFNAAAHAAQSGDSHAYLRLGPAVERIARLHAQSGQEVMAAKTRRALAQAVRDFDDARRAALAGAQGSEARDNYILLAMLWQDYREWLQRPPSRDTARRLRDRTEEVAWVASKGVRLVNDASPGSVPSMALRASQAALASQRIAKVYLWRRWDIRDEALDRELREARESLPRLLTAIATTPGLDADLAAQVDSALTQWRFLSDAAAQLDRTTTDKRALEFACKAADHIDEAMARVIESSTLRWR